MAVLCQHYKEMEECAAALARKKLPHRMRSGLPAKLAVIQVPTKYTSKGLK